MNPQRFKKSYAHNKEGIITYIMSASFRIHYNHGLQKAINLSKTEHKELQIILLKEDEENDRNNVFFTKGIQGFQGFLSKFTNNVYFFNELTDFFYKLIEKSSQIFKDRAYLKEHLIIENAIKTHAQKHNIPLTLVESNVLVPVLYTSDKEEYAARTIRPKIMKKIEEFIDFEDSLNPSFMYEQEARDVLHHFIDVKLNKYNQRNEPSSDHTSGLSPYLKYGFISPLEIYIKVMNSNKHNKDSFIEELIVRRELSYNFVFYNKNYDKLNQFSIGWAFDTMREHDMDPKEHIYSIDDYHNYNTHDKYFNAAMKEMVHFGKMHGYMRMYWAKKIIEWSPSFADAYYTLIKLNNYYFLDGNTPNGYTGVAWCFGKHDRAFKERIIFGKLRYMSDSGLKRKFDMEKYISRIDRKVGNENV